MTLCPHDLVGVCPFDLGNPLNDSLGHSMVYDSLKRKLVMFAGQQESNRYLNDMWEYDLHRQTLIELTSNFTGCWRA